MKSPEKILSLFLSVFCPDGEIGRRTVFRSQRLHGCAGSNPVLGTKARVSVGLSVKKENLLTLKLKLTLFFCGFEYERFYSGLFFTCSRGAKAQTHTHTLKIRISLGTRVYSSFGGRVVLRHVFLKRVIKLALVFK